MVFDLDGHALDRGVVAGPFGHCPAFERISYLEPEVVVTPAGVVELHHKNRALSLGRSFPWLRLPSLVESALAAVFREAHRTGSLAIPTWPSRAASGELAATCTAVFKRSAATR
jgi:hypothetical protein